MLTTTLDGLWLLQVLTGIEVLAPELGLRPHLPSAETPEMAMLHPAASDLLAAGVIDPAGAVDETVREWLTVLARRDVSVLMYVQTPGAGPASERILLARFAHWWVALERFGEGVRISGAGTATSEHAAGLLIGAQIERLCGSLAPAAFKPVTIDAAQMLTAVKDSQSLRTFLLERKLDSDQLAILALAADADLSAQASIVAIQAGTDAGPARSHVDGAVVTIIDTPQGRLVSEHISRGGRTWMIVSPGTHSNVSSAVVEMLRNLPAEQNWHSHRKAV